MRGGFYKCASNEVFIVFRGIGIEFNTHTHTHNDVSALFTFSLSLHLSPDPNHCQFAGLAGEIRNPPRIIERHPIPAVAKMIIPRPASLDTFWGSGKNQASVSIIKIGGFGPDTMVAIFVIVVACCTLSRG